MLIIQLNRGAAVLFPIFIRRVRVSNKPVVRETVEKEAKSYPSHRNKKENIFIFFSQSIKSSNFDMN